MRIGVISRSLLDMGGGIENYLHNIFTTLARNHTIVVLTQRFDNENYRRNYEVKHPRFRSLPVYLIWAALKRKRLSLDSDLVISGSALTAPLVQISSKPTLCFVYGIDLVYPNQLYQFFFPPALLKVNYLIACSNATKALCVERGISAQKVFVVHPGVDADRFKPDKTSGLARRQALGIPEHDPVVFSVSRHVRKKGILRLVCDIAPRLLENLPKVKFVIGGRGPQTEQIKSTIRKLALQKSVIFVGFIPDKDLPSFYNMANVFSLPEEPVFGDFEGFGMVHLEASACGVPSVGSRMEAAVEAIEDGVRGVACDPYNIEDHVEAIKRFLLDKEYHYEFSSRCRQTVLEKWTIEKTTAVASDIMGHILERSYRNSDVPQGRTE